MFLESIKVKINEYIVECKTKSVYHKTNASTSKRYNNALTMTSTLLAAAMGISMTVLTVVDASNIINTLIGASFAGIITVVQKIKEDYSFAVLVVQHHQAADDFDFLYSEFEKILAEFNTGRFIQDDLNHLIAKYNLTVSKNHIQNIRECPSFCCHR